MSLRRSLFRLSLASFLALGACNRIDSAAVQAWKANPTPEAGDKLAAAVKDEGTSAAVRAEAAAALVEVGLAPEMEAAVSSLEINTRAGLIPAIVPKLKPVVDGADVEKSGDAQGALFSLREQSTTAEARKSVEDVLFPALIKDIRTGRERAGRAGVGDMLKGIGAPVVPLLLPLLEDPAVPFGTAVEVIEKVGDAAAREKGGDALVARAKKLGSAPGSVPELLYAAMATLGGKQAVAFLQAAVEANQAPDVDRAAASMLKLPPRSEGLSSFAVRKAGNALTPAPLREQLFQVAERDRGDESKKALLALIAGTSDAAIRHRAFRAVLKATGGPGILEALEAYPARVRLTEAELKTEIVTPLQVMPGMDTRGPLFKAFESKAPLARLVAILVISNMGFKSDAKPIAKLVKDPGAVPGLPGEYRVGTAATKAVAKLEAIKS